MIIQIVRYGRELIVDVTPKGEQGHAISAKCHIKNQPNVTSVLCEKFDLQNSMSILRHCL